MNSLAASAWQPPLGSPLISPQTDVFNSSILSLCSLSPPLHLPIFYLLLLIFTVDPVRFSHFFVSFSLHITPNAVPFTLINNNNSDFLLVVFVIPWFSSLTSTLLASLVLHFICRKDMSLVFIQDICNSCVADILLYDHHLVFTARIYCSALYLDFLVTFS